MANTVTVISLESESSSTIEAVSNIAVQVQLFQYRGRARDFRPVTNSTLRDGV